MAYETVVAVFDTPAHAQAAVKALRAGGFASADISVLDEERLVAGQSGKAAGVKDAGLWRRLFGKGVHEHEAAVYGQTVAHGGDVVSVRVLDNEVAHAIAILDLHHPVSVPDRAVTTGAATPSYVDAVEKKVVAEPLAAKQKIAVPAKLAEAQPEVLKLAEEQLEIGKKMVQTGRTRVRRFVTEREATADVTLHEEHAEVLRRAVNEPKFLTDVDWADKEIEVVETAEQALVKKTARIVEEISLKHVGSDHVETVKEKLRRQQADVEHLGPGGAPGGGAHA